MRSLLLAGALLAACGSSTNNQDNSFVMDLSGPDLALLSRCGHPGDTGNSQGVGLFCQQFSDCSGNLSAKFCSAIINSPTPSPNDSYFCTLSCSPTDPPSVCGENAYCPCMGGQCGCAPNRCRNYDLGVSD